MRGLLLLTLLLLSASGCADDPPDEISGAAPAPVLPPAPPAASADAAEPPEPATPQEAFDAPTTVFDTVEAPPARTLAPPRPLPPPPVPPREPSRPPPPADAEAVWGRCDVRPSEPYCFSYIGPGWTAADAEAHCASAPGGSFSAPACPDARRIATCTFERPGEEGQSLVYAYYAPYPLDLARLACPGEFREGD